MDSEFSKMEGMEMEVSDYFQISQISNDGCTETQVTMATGSRKSSHHQFPPCQVCGDKSSGRNFGVFTCNGCRSFFRRTVREGRKFTCKFGGKCEINIDARLHCRACRYQKSLKVGMEPQSVLLTPTTGKPEPDPENAVVHISTAFQDSQKHSAVSLMLQNFRQAETQLDLKFAPWFPKNNLQLATSMNQVYDSITTKLRYVVEWAKSMEVFQQLDTPSKIALLRTHCTELVNLETARISVDPGEEPDYFVGANGLKIFGKSRTSKGAAARIFCELITPCRTMRVTDEEFWCLKALAMFNPHTTGLSEKDRGIVGGFQQKVRLILETIVKEDKVRMFNLLMVMPMLSNLSEKLRSDLGGYKKDNSMVTYKLIDDLVAYDQDT